MKGAGSAARSARASSQGRARAEGAPRASAVSALDAHLGYWLRCVSNYVSHAFKLRVEARGVTVAEWVVLRALFDHDGITPGELAEKLGLSRGAVSKLIQRLTAKHLVSSRRVEGDRRSLSIALCASGRALVPSLAKLADENDAAAFGHLSARERAELRALLESIARRHGLDGAPID